MSVSCPSVCLSMQFSTSSRSFATLPSPPLLPPHTHPSSPRPSLALASPLSHTGFAALHDLEMPDAVTYLKAALASGGEELGAGGGEMHYGSLDAREILSYVDGLLPLSPPAFVPRHPARLHSVGAGSGSEVHVQMGQSGLGFRPGGGGLLNSMIVAKLESSAGGQGEGVGGAEEVAMLGEVVYEEVLQGMTEIAVHARRCLRSRRRCAGARAEEELGGDVERDVDTALAKMCVYLGDRRLLASLLMEENRVDVEEVHVCVGVAVAVVLG